KDSYSRKKETKKDTIDNQEFMDYTKSIWTFPSVSAKKIGHPAPFPEELPRRLIQLYSFEGDIILDPFMGSGQTAIAALKSGRHFVGYETDKIYCELAQKRISEITNQKKL
ncbi:MAG: DNA-methyltransferase, partial [Candidatus Micrarchaeaceae archaeon]